MTVNKANKGFLIVNFLLITWITFWWFYNQTVSTPLHDEFDHLVFIGLLQLIQTSVFILAVRNVYTIFKQNDAEQDWLDRRPLPLAEFNLVRDRTRARIEIMEENPNLGHVTEQMITDWLAGVREFNVDIINDDVDIYGLDRDTAAEVIGTSRPHLKKSKTIEKIEAIVNEDCEMCGLPPGDPNCECSTFMKSYVQNSAKAMVIRVKLKIAQDMQIVIMLKNRFQGSLEKVYDPYRGIKPMRKLRDIDYDESLISASIPFLTASEIIEIINRGH